MIRDLIDEFKRSISKVLVHEGGYVDHPLDPGGATNRGVTQRVYDAFRLAAKQVKRSVRLITEDEVFAIYRTRYWNLIKGDSLPPGVGYVVFDGAVNSGVKQSVLWLQRALGIRADGVVGPDTINATNDYPDHDRLIAKIIERREKFLRALKTFKTFGKGWISRINGVLAVGQAWAMGSVGPEIQFVVNGNAKARIEDAKSPPPKAVGDATTGVGGASVVISQATDQLSPFANIEFVAKVIAGLTVVGAVVTIGGIAYRVWANKKSKELNDALDIVPA